MEASLLRTGGRFSWQRELAHLPLLAGLDELPLDGAEDFPRLKDLVEHVGRGGRAGVVDQRPLEPRHHTAELDTRCVIGNRAVGKVRCELLRVGMVLRDVSYQRPNVMVVRWSGRLSRRTASTENGND